MARNNHWKETLRLYVSLFLTDMDRCRHKQANRNGRRRARTLTCLHVCESKCEFIWLAFVWRARVGVKGDIVWSKWVMFDCNTLTRWVLYCWIYNKVDQCLCSLPKMSILKSLWSDLKTVSSNARVLKRGQSQSDCKKLCLSLSYNWQTTLHVLHVNKH